MDTKSRWIGRPLKPSSYPSAIQLFASNAYSIYDWLLCFSCSLSLTKNAHSGVRRISYTASATSITGVGGRKTDSGMPWNISNSWSLAPVRPSDLLTHIDVAEDHGCHSGGFTSSGSCS